MSTVQYPGPFNYYNLRSEDSVATSSVPFFVAFVVFLCGMVFTAAAIGAHKFSAAILIFTGTFVVSVFVGMSIKVIPQWEKALVLRMGRFSSLKGPGLFFIIPIFEKIKRVDTRVLTLDIPGQQVITKDNVPLVINGVLYFKVVNVEDAIIKVQDYIFAVSQYAQTALRDIVGGMNLDEILTEREKIGEAIEKVVEKVTQNWGLEVHAIKLQDIEMPEDLKKMMSRQASAEREKRATITKAEGDKLAALNLAEAARIMRESKGAMQLRTLQTIDGLGPTSSNTVVIALPIEIMEAIQSFTASKNQA